MDVRVLAWLGLLIWTANLAVGPTLSPVQWVMDYLSPGVKGPECGASCSVVYAAELRMLEPLFALLRQAWDISLNRRADWAFFF